MLTFISSMFATMTNAFRPMTVVGMTEYVLLEEGKQMNGVISAVGGFSYKCGTALSNAILAGAGQDPDQDSHRNRKDLILI